jgi:general secretion pathway protein K
MKRKTYRHLRLKRAFPVPSNEGGFVLVTILLVIAILFPLVLAFTSRVQVNLLQAENFRNSVQAVRLSRSGVEGAIGILKTDDPSYDTLKDTWALDFPTLSVGYGSLEVKIKDEDGKIPVNQLVLPNGVDVNKDVEQRLRNLISRLGGRPEVVDALIDWIDTDDAVTGAAGAEYEYYKPLGYASKNGPIDSLDELSMIKGFDKELLFDRDLLDYLTVAQTDGKINVNTAPAEVLFALLGTKSAALAQPLNDSDLEDLIRYRDEHEFKNVQDVNAVVKISAAQAGNISSLIKVNSAFFTVSSKCKLGKVVYNSEALLQRDGKNITTISWREF